MCWWYKCLILIGTEVKWVPSSWKISYFIFPKTDCKIKANIKELAEVLGLIHLARKYVCHFWLLYLVERSIQPSFFVCLFFKAAPTVYRISQTRGWIRATAAGLHHSIATPDPNRICDLYHSSRQGQILNPLIEAGDWTRNLLVTSRVH